MASHVSTLDSRRRVRRTFGQLAEVTPMPNLIDVQRSSYDSFLQMDIAAHVRDEHGLHGNLQSIFPIEDFNEAASSNSCPTISRSRNMMSRNASSAALPTPRR